MKFLITVRKVYTEEFRHSLSRTAGTQNTKSYVDGFDMYIHKTDFWEPTTITSRVIRCLNPLKYRL